MDAKKKPQKFPTFIRSGKNWMKFKRSENLIERVEWKSVHRTICEKGQSILSHFDCDKRKLID